MTGGSQHARLRLPERSPLRRLLERVSGSVLFGWALLTLLLLPYLDNKIIGIPVAKLLLAAVFVSAFGVRGVSQLGIAILGSAIVFGNVDELSPSTAAFVAAASLRALALGYTGVVSLREALRERQVTVHTIARAASVYLLIGFFWSQIYAIADRIEPGSLSVPQHWMTTDPNARLRYLYFSFVTLATLGFGDVVPAQPGLAALTLVEALVGQLYMATLIARLVALHTVASRPAEHEGE
ncbi:MAG TPA: potassium channel family protein [Candidatus Acidoferrales bacterium]|nr:potassium channel family protein [Candidatus Acidoferrales bacterium]